MKSPIAVATAVVATALIVVTLASPSPASASGYVSESQVIDDILRAVDYRSNDSDTLRLYRAFLNRDPDVPGSIYWISQTRGGSNPDDLAYGFAQSAEFSARYGTLSNAEFLTLLYSNMLDRLPDQDGFNYWLQLMNEGLSQHAVVRWIVANDEFINRFPFTALQPLSPGDSMNCADFATQADAQAWFNHFFPQFGDVAVLDGNNDMIACESLP